MIRWDRDPEHFVEYFSIISARLNTVVCSESRLFTYYIALIFSFLYLLRQHQILWVSVYISWHNLGCWYPRWEIEGYSNSCLFSWYFKMTICWKRKAKNREGIFLSIRKMPRVQSIFLFFSAGVEPRTSCMPGMHFTSQIYT